MAFQEFAKGYLFLALIHSFFLLTMQCPSNATASAWSYFKGNCVIDFYLSYSCIQILYLTNTTAVLEAVPGVYK